MTRTENFSSPVPPQTEIIYGVKLQPNGTWANVAEEVPSRDELDNQNNLHGHPDALGRHLAVHGGYRADYLDGLMVDYYRGEIASLDSWDLHRAAVRMDLKNMPRGLRAAVAGGKPPDRLKNTEILENLARRRADGKPLIDNRTFAEVMCWHNANLSARQQRYESEGLPREREDFRQRVTAAVDGAKAWLPRKALARLPQIEAMPVYIDDGFSTTVKGHAAHLRRVGLKPGEAPSITISNATDSSVLRHEFSHGLAGTDNLSGEDLKRVNIGLCRIFGDGSGGEAIEEACTDLIASVLGQGRIHATNPNSKYRQDMAYLDEGNLLHTLCTKGVRKVDPRLFINAQIEDSADRDAAGEQSASAILQRALSEAFPGKDIVAQIARPDFEGSRPFAFRLARQYLGRRIGAALLMRRRARS